MCLLSSRHWKLQIFEIWKDESVLLSHPNTLVSLHCYLTLRLVETAESGSTETSADHLALQFREYLALDPQEEGI